MKHYWGALRLAVYAEAAFAGDWHDPGFAVARAVSRTSRVAVVLFPP